jgi:hypothetical protein
MEIEVFVDSKTLCFGFSWDVGTIEQVQTFSFYIPLLVVRFSFARKFHHAIQLPKNRILAAIAMFCGGVIVNDVARFDSFEASYHFYWVCSNLFPSAFDNTNDCPF